MNKIFLSILFLLVNLTVFAQKDKPDWLETGNKPLSKSEKFVYVIGIGTDNFIDTAQMKAFNNMVRELSRNEGETYYVEGVTKLNIENNVSNRNVNTNSNLKFSGTIYSKGNKMSKFIQEIDFYRNGLEYYGLYRIAKNKKDLELPVYYYPAIKKGLSFIPGVAQFKKQEKAKGLIFLGGEISLLTGLVISQVLYSNYDYDYNYYIQKSDLNNAEISRYNRDKTNVARVSCLIGTAGLYAYNIIDGLLIKGKPKYTNRNFKFYPNLAFNNFGLSVSFSL